MFPRHNDAPAVDLTHCHYCGSADVEADDYDDHGYLCCERCCDAGNSHVPSS